MLSEITRLKQNVRKQMIAKSFHFQCIFNVFAKEKFHLMRWKLNIGKIYQLIWVSNTRTYIYLNSFFSKTNTLLSFTIYIFKLILGIFNSNFSFKSKGTILTDWLKCDFFYFNLNKAHNDFKLILIWDPYWGWF